MKEYKKISTIMKKRFSPTTKRKTINTLGNNQSQQSRTRNDLTCEDALKLIRICLKGYCYVFSIEPHNAGGDRDTIGAHTDTER